MMRIAQTQQQQQQQQQQSTNLHELSSLVLNILRSPPSSVVTTPSRRGRGSAPVAMASITPAGFASMMLGVSLTLMLCGSVTFILGFLLLPWVIALVMVFYFVGLVSGLSVLGRSFLYYCAASPPPTPPWKFM